MANTRHRRPTFPDRRGAAIVELALVLPISMLLIVVSIDLCWLQVIRHTADITAYEAAKSSFVPGADDQEIASAATEQLKRFRVHDAEVSVASSPQDGAGESVTVDISIPIASNTWTLASFRRAVAVQRQLQRQ